MTKRERAVVRAAMRMFKLSKTLFTWKAMDESITELYKACDALSRAPRKRSSGRKRSG